MNVKGTYLLFYTTYNSDELIALAFWERFFLLYVEVQALYGDIGTYPRSFFSNSLRLLSVGMAKRVKLSLYQSGQGSRHASNEGRLPAVLLFHYLVKRYYIVRLLLLTSLLTK